MGATPAIILMNNRLRKIPAASNPNSHRPVAGTHSSLLNRPVKLTHSSLLITRPQKNFHCITIVLQALPPSNVPTTPSILPNFPIPIQTNESKLFPTFNSNLHSPTELKTYHPNLHSPAKPNLSNLFIKVPTRILQLKFPLDPI